MPVLVSVPAAVVLSLPELFGFLQTTWSGTWMFCVEQIWRAYATAAFLPASSQASSRQQAMPSRNCSLLQMQAMSS